MASIYSITCPTRPLHALPWRYRAAFGQSTSNNVHAARRPRRTLRIRAEAEEEGTSEDVVYNTEFGYSRKDVILIGVLTIGAGYGLYYGLQFFGVGELQAGSIAQLIIFLGIVMTWVITYLFRVGNKDMTYVTQLKDYEEAVMQKRLEEMTEAEVDVMMEEIEKEKQKAMESKE